MDKMIQEIVEATVMPPAGKRPGLTALNCTGRTDI